MAVLNLRLFARRFVARFLRRTRHKLGVEGKHLVADNLEVFVSVWIDSDCDNGQTSDRHFSVPRHVERGKNFGPWWIFVSTGAPTEAPSFVLARGQSTTVGVEEEAC